MVAHWIDCICWFSLCFLDQVMACQFKALLCIEVYWIKKQPIDSKGHVPWRHVRHLGKLLGGNSPKVANLLSHTNDNDNGNPLSAASKDLWPGSFEERSLRKKVIDFVKNKRKEWKDFLAEFLLHLIYLDAYSGLHSYLIFVKTPPSMLICSVLHAYSGPKCKLPWSKIYGWG